MMSRLIILSFILLSVSACKTQEDIRREKTVENLNEKIVETQKTTASSNSRFNSIEEQLARLTGQLEEANHSRAEALKEAQNLNSRINALEETNKGQVEYIKALTEKVNNQSAYIEEVIASLAKLSEKDKSSKKKTVIPDSVNIDDEEEGLKVSFDNGLKKYRAKELDEAREIFLKISEDKKMKKKDREGSLHYLGMIDFKNKKYDSAKVYFSKLFSNNPNSSFAPATLLNLAKTFKELKSEEEAKFTLEELLERFPKSKEASEAVKLKETL